MTDPWDRIDEAFRYLMTRYITQVEFNRATLPERANFQDMLEARQQRQQLQLQIQQQQPTNRNFSDAGFILYQEGSIVFPIGAAFAIIHTGKSGMRLVVNKLM